MKKLKMFLDMVMMVMMILLMKLDITSLAIHELMGIGVFVLFLIHKGLNFKWIKAVTMRLTDNKLGTKTKIMYFVDVLLVIFVALNVISGILISKSLFPWIQINNGELMTRLHYLFAYGSLIIIMIHLYLHWNMILAMMQIRNHKLFVKTLMAILTVIILAFSIKVSNVKKIFIENAEIHTGVENNTNNEVIFNDKHNNSSAENAENEKGSTVSSGGKDVKVPSLEEYLSKLFCTGCGRHCPLTSPQCGNGVRQGKEKVQQYNSTYGTNLTYDFSK